MHAPNGAKLEIVLTPAGGCSVSGPLHDKLLCYAMLKVGEQLIQAFDPAKQPGPPPILLARGNLPPLSNGDKP